MFKTELFVFVDLHLHRMWNKQMIFHFSISFVASMNHEEKNIGRCRFIWHIFLRILHFVFILDDVIERHLLTNVFHRTRRFSHWMKWWSSSLSFVKIDTSIVDICLDKVNIFVSDQHQQWFEHLLILIGSFCSGKRYWPFFWRMCSRHFSSDQSLSNGIQIGLISSSIKQLCQQSFFFFSLFHILFFFSDLKCD